MEVSDTDGDEWIIKTEEQTKRDQAIDEGVDALSSLINQRPRSEDDGSLKLTFVYTAKDTSGNMFTREKLETMKRVRKKAILRQIGQIHVLSLVPNLWISLWNSFS